MAVVTLEVVVVAIRMVVRCFGSLLGSRCAGGVLYEFWRLAVAVV